MLDMVVWLYLVAYGWIMLDMVVWLYLVAYGCVWLYMVVYDCMGLSGVIWQWMGYLEIPQVPLVSHRFVLLFNAIWSFMVWPIFSTWYTCDLPGDAARTQDSGASLFAQIEFGAYRYFRWQWCQWFFDPKIVVFLSSAFFPRASERRVLLIVEVCHHILSSHLLLRSSHLHILSSHLLLRSSHLHIFLHIFTSSHIFSHLLIFSHLHIFSHLLIFSHLHIFSHLLTSSHIFSHLLIFTSSSHLLTSSHLHIFSHLLIFISSHIFSHLLTSSHIFSHLLTSSHIFSSSYLLASSHIFSLLPSCSLALLPSSLSLFSISLFRPGGSANEASRNATFSHEMKFDREKLG